MHECITYVLITSLETIQFALNLLIFDVSNSFIILLNMDLKIPHFCLVWTLLRLYDIFSIFRKCKSLSLFPFIECITSFQYSFIANFITLANLKKKLSSTSFHQIQSFVISHKFRVGKLNNIHGHKVVPSASFLSQIFRVYDIALEFATLSASSRWKSWGNLRDSINSFWSKYDLNQAFKFHFFLL